MKDYIIEQTKEGNSLTREVRDRKIKYIPGLSTADPENSDRPRKREEYLEQVLNPMIEREEIGDGVKSKFDDRKFRFHSASIEYEPTGMHPMDYETILQVQLGITHYQECTDCRDWDEEKRNEMIERGEKIFNEPNAFFTRGCGIGATPITSEGSIFVGKRQPGDNSFSGELGAVNGWVDYKERLEEIDFTQDVLREMREEYGIIDEDVDKLIFVGIFSAPAKADTDFAYLAPLRINNKEFLEKFKTRRDNEHGNLVKIANYEEMRTLLETGRLHGVEEEFNLVYCLRGSLEQIRPDEMA